VLAEREVAPNVYEGYTPNYTSVRFSSGTKCSNTILSVAITGEEDTYCIGTIV
jgi:threonylcarbamoyladenosine tRNA methylthiotransferase MtaB